MDTPINAWFEKTIHLAILRCCLNYQTRLAIAQFARLRPLSSQTHHQTHQDVRPWLVKALYRLLPLKLSHPILFENKGFQYFRANHLTLLKWVRQRL